MSACYHLLCDQIIQGINYFYCNVEKNYNVIMTYVIVTRRYCRWKSRLMIEIWECCVLTWKLYNKMLRSFNSHEIICGIRQLENADMTLWDVKNKDNYIYNYIYKYIYIYINCKRIHCKLATGCTALSEINRNKHLTVIYSDTELFF